MAASIFWNGTDHELRCNYLKNEAGTGAPEATHGISFPNGQGLDFSATAGGGATSSLLDDYEEGTFTPTIVGSTTAGTGTYTIQVGRYTKVGNRVIFQMYVSITAHTGTGNIQIDSLPYAHTSSANSYTSCTIGYMDSMTYTGTEVMGYIATGLSKIILVQSTSGATISSIPIDTAFGIMISGSYEV